MSPLCCCWCRLTASAAVGSVTHHCHLRIYGSRQAEPAIWFGLKYDSKLIYGLDHNRIGSMLKRILVSLAISAPLLLSATPSGIGWLP
jgi:hypothetical protein